MYRIAMWLHMKLRIRNRHRKTHSCLTQGTDVLAWKHSFHSPRKKSKRGMCHKILFLSQRTWIPASPATFTISSPTWEAKKFRMEVVWEYALLFGKDDICTLKHICICLEAVQTYTTSKQLTLSVVQHRRICQFLLKCSTEKDLMRASPIHTCCCNILPRQTWNIHSQIINTNDKKTRRN